jgi:AraC-binding-like domain
MIQHWSSSEIVARERLGFWVDVVCRTLVNLRCEPTSDQKFFGEIDFDEFGGLKLVSVRSVAQRVSRTGEALGSATGFFHVNIMRAGHGLMDQDGREAELAPGGFVFFDSSRPYAIDFIDNFSAGVLRIPRSMLLQRIGVPECFTALRVDHASGLGARVASMLRDLPAQLPTIPKTVHERVADNIVDLIAAALLSTGVGAPRSARLTLTRVKFWIETHLAENFQARRSRIVAVFRSASSTAYLKPKAPRSCITCGSGGWRAAGATSPILRSDTARSPKSRSPTALTIRRTSVACSMRVSVFLHARQGVRASSTTLTE